jgi:hypothetical protein
MEMIVQCCAGLDVHKTNVVACVRRIDPAGRVHEAIQTFGTMTAEVLAGGFPKRVTLRSPQSVLKPQVAAQAA